MAEEAAAGEGVAAAEAEEAARGGEDGTGVGDHKCRMPQQLTSSHKKLLPAIADLKGIGPPSRETLTIPSSTAAGAAAAATATTTTGGQKWPAHITDMRIFLGATNFGRNGKVADIPCRSSAQGRYLRRGHE